jgi:oxygen-independent coproporphyrinogen-3 oxidase
MAGIYLHIPFCKQACVYCDFHFSTSLKNKEALVSALLREAELRQDFIGDTTVNSIYFGGGTPSLLSAPELQKIISGLQQLFNLNPQAEITLEANPDDLKPAYLNALAQTPVNRLSIGLQSFRPQDLRFMNRAHSAQESLQSIKQAQAAGFTNLTIDLIYGLPNYPVGAWRDALWQVQDLGVPHFSAYALTVEPKTALLYQIEKGKLPPLDEALAAQHFEALQNFTKETNYVHYELSSISLPGFEAKHNASYWQGVPYLGLGPSAHGYKKGQRSWNVRNNTFYLKAIEKNELALEQENLSLADEYNERVMTQLRLASGLSLSALEKDFGASYLHYALKQAQKLLTHGQLVKEGDWLKIAETQRFYSDGLAAELFWVA